MITWAVGRSKQYGYLNFNNKDNARNAAATMHGRIIDGSQIKCSYDEAISAAPDSDSMEGCHQAKPNTSIKVSNLSQDTDEDSLISAFARCGMKGVSTASLIWEAPTEMECKGVVHGDQIIMTVLDMLCELTSHEGNGDSAIKAISLFPEKATSKKRGCKVRVTLSSLECVQTAMEILDGKPASEYNLSKHGKIRVRQDLGCNFFIPPRIAGALSTSIHAAAQDICDHGFVIARVLEKAKKGTTVALKGFHEGYMLRAGQILSRLITPEHFYVGGDGDQLHTLFSGEFFKCIEEINTSVPGVHVHLDKQINRILIYGEDVARRAARKLLMEHAQKMLAEPSVVIELMPGEIKELVGQHGQGDEDIQKRSGCSKVNLDIRRQTVTCVGPQEALAAAQALIRDVLTRARATSRVAVDHKNTVGICPVCTCNIEKDESFVRLQACGHAYHRECIGWLLGSYAKLSGPPLPVTCAYARADDQPCTGALLCIRDLQTLCSPDTLHKLYKRAYRQYVEANLASLLLCPTPDCPQVVPRDRHGTWTCDCCTKSYCVQCTVALGTTAEGHPGVFCEQYRKLASQPENDALFQEYLEGELGTGSVKKCPNCKLAQGKDDKCNHVECAKCGKHWCFRCGIFYTDNGLAIYGHFSSKQGGCTMYHE